MNISRSVILKMTNVSDIRCRENQNTHFVFHDFFFRISCGLWDMWKKILYSWTSRKLQYGLYALHAVYQSLQTHTQNMWHLLLSHCNNSCTNSAPHCYAIWGTLPILFTLCWRWQKSVYSVSIHRVTTISTLPSSLSLWPPTYCFSARNMQ
jgi:hypothetical protein